MRLPRRAPLLLLALCLLTFPATAYAASAWVLWEHAYEVWVVVTGSVCILLQQNMTLAVAESATRCHFRN